MRGLDQAERRLEQKLERDRQRRTAVIIHNSKIRAQNRRPISTRLIRRLRGR